MNVLVSGLGSLTSLGLMYYKPDENSKSHGTSLAVGSKIGPIAKYTDDNGIKWFRTNSGWLKRDFLDNTNLGEISTNT